MRAVRVSATRRHGWQQQKYTVHHLLLLLLLWVAVCLSLQSRVAYKWSKRVPKVYISCNGCNAFLLPGVEWSWLRV
jgi:hypothetical protein